MMPAGARRGGQSRWRVRAGYPLAVIYLWLAEPSPLSLALGAVFAVAGLAVRAAAAGHLRKHEVLATGGPYACTRNPLYFGSALIAAGMLVAGRSWLAALLVAGYFVLFYPAVMRCEEEEIRARYGAAFEAYAAEVPLFWPRLHPPRRGSGASAGFSWEQYRKNREYQAASGALLGWLLLWAKMRWFL